MTVQKPNPKPVVDSRALHQLFITGWQLVEGREAIRKEFLFRNFVEAMDFMARAAVWAEKLNHHPEWSNIYRTVTVELITHTTNGLTELDLKLARKLDELAGY